MHADERFVNQKQRQIYKVQAGKEYRGLYGNVQKFFIVWSLLKGLGGSTVLSHGV